MAECYDRSWRVGSKARGTRSQFRLSTGLLPFKCTYPSHITDVMDVIPSTSSDLRRTEFTSPVRGTRTRTVREYEQTIDELKKENFDLKLRLFLFEDPKNKNHPRNKGSCNEEQDNNVQISVELQIEVETLRNELNSKTQLLQEALDEKLKCEVELKELQNRFEELQEQLSSFSSHSSEQELMLLRDEIESLQKSNENFTLLVAEKDQNNELLNAQVEELSTENEALKKKVEKGSLAIQGLVTKYCKDIEMIPKDLRPVVQTAVQAAKQNRSEDLSAAIENFKRSLSDLRFANGGSSSEAKNNAVRGKDSVEELQKLADSSKSSVELSKNPKSKHGHDGKDVQVSTESLFDSTEQMLEVVKENENLKSDIDKQTKIIDELNKSSRELEKKSIQLQSELLDAVTKIKELDTRLREEKSKHIGSLPKKHSSVQTAVQWHLMQSKLSDKFVQNAGHSNNLEDLKEEILTLLLVIEQKDKEISDCEEKLASLQQQLEIENKKETTFDNLDKDFVKERDELRERLANSCAINSELIKHLRNLETFMEDLLQHKNLSVSSIENLSESASFLSCLKIQREIEQTLELSNVLNEELSICEGSKIFNPNDLTTNQDVSSRFSYQTTDTSRFGLDLSNIPSSIQGRESSQLSLQETSKNAIGTGKRRLSFSTLHNSSLDATICDKENVVVLGTSNNEDLILLLNEKGDPEDVLIRNNYSRLEGNPSAFGDGDQHRRRCWESSAMSYLTAEKSVLDHRTEQWCSSKVDGSKLASGLFNPYPSSDSDIWSEPDRDVSLQRIGIDLQKSPVSQKSPRRSRFRDKLSTDEVTSLKNESSSSFSKLHTWSKRRKNSDTSRSSFICKKCMAQSQTSDTPTKGEKMDSQMTMDELASKCSSQENDLEKLGNELQNKNNAVQALMREKEELLSCMNRLKESQNFLVEKETSSTEKLDKINSEYNKLQILLAQYEARINDSDAMHNQLKSDLEKNKNQSKLLEQKCLEYENELADYDALIKEKQELVNYIFRLEQSQKFSIENEANNAEKLAKMSSDYHKLLSTLKQFETKIIHSDAMCNQLKGDLEKSKIQVQLLEQNCEEYVEELAMHANSKNDYSEKLHAVEEEKSKLIHDIETLMQEKRELLSKIEAEKANRQRLENENGSLIKKLTESSKEVSLLRASSKDLEDTKVKLMKEKASCETKLMSNNSICDLLKIDLKKTQERLEKMELKCAEYEKELNKSSKSKQNIIQSLSGVKSVISSNIDVLSSLYKKQLKCDGVTEIDKGTVISAADKDEQIETMIEEIISVNTKFEQIIKSLSEQLSSMQSSMEKNKLIEDEYKSKIYHLQQQLGDKEKEIHSLKMHMIEIQQKLEEHIAVNKEYQSQLEFAQNRLQVTGKEMKTLREHKNQIQSLFGEFQQALKEKEKSLADSNLKASASEKQLSSVQDEVHKYQNLINLKDDEITKLQERVFNLQTQINSVLGRVTSPAGQGSSKDNNSDILSNSVKTNAHLSSENEANEETMSIISNDTSFSSTTSAKDDLGRKVDRYARKIKALQTKLSMTEKRIEILEHEKAVLREELLVEPRGGKDKSKAHEEIDSFLKEIDELKSTLKTKNSFIKDLKSELLKTCNSLLDKQKEVDEYKHKLSASNSNTDPGVQSPVHVKLRPSYSDPIQKTMEATIKELKNQKWELMNGILGHQKQLYERKNIHLGHFEKFKKHIEKLRSLQVSPSLFKSESEPLLNNPMATNSFYAEKCDKTLKNLQIELQVDVEYLQNLKIFLKRFFVPFALQKCSCNNTSSKPDDDSNAAGKNAVNATKDSEREHLRLDLWKSSSAEVILHSPTISDSDSLIATTSVVAQRINIIETALKDIKSALEHFQETGSPIGETPKKTAAKSLLLKILEELVNLDGGFTEVFRLNSTMKSLGLSDISIPQSPSKQESDRESVLSEETIALSRCGSLSPMSFDENFPLMRSFSNSLKHKQESDHFDKSLVGMKQKLEVTHRLQAVGGSQESLFLRSHFSSPDLGIESDPNHDSSAPEQAEKEISRMSKRQSEAMHSFTDSSSKIKDASFGMGDVLHAIGHLEEYELLKKEVQESFIGIKTVLSRTGDGLRHLSKFTSPHKNLEYSTFKAIKDSCGNIEVCLQKAVKLVDNFWIAPCPSVKELNMLIQQNQELQDKLKQLMDSKRRQEIHFKEAMEQCKQAERRRENMEKKISKKLIKTKKVIRQAEIKMLEKESQDLPSIPKYPCD